MKPTPGPTTAPPWTGSPFRRRRILWTLALLTLGGLYYLATHGAPPGLSSSLSESLKDWGYYRASPDSSRPGRVAQAKHEHDHAHPQPHDDEHQHGHGEQQQEQEGAEGAYAGSGTYTSIHELDALLHFLTAHPTRRLDEDSTSGGPDSSGDSRGSIRVEGLGSVVVDPARRVDLRVYAPDGAGDWEAHTRRVRERFPLVVFSKTYCPYSQRAKALLASYEIEPASKIIELNVRSDGPLIQAILGRLTGRKTVPNVLLKGSSIGGSDDLYQMHEEHKLKTLLEEGGLTVKGAAADV